MIGLGTEAGFLYRKLITLKIPTFIEPRYLHEGRCAKFCTVPAIEPPLPANDPVRRSRKTRKKLPEYFNGTTFCEHIKDMPNDMINRTPKLNDILHLCHEGVASDVMNYMKNDLLKDHSRIVEINPGIGYLTKKMIEAGVEFVKALEPKNEFFPFMNKLSREYPDKLVIDRTDFINLWKLVYLDRLDQAKRVDQIFSEFTKVPWDEQPGLKIVGAVANSKLVSFVMMDVIRQSKCSSYGRPCLYLCIPPYDWEKLTCKGPGGPIRYTAISVLFQTIFDYKLLGEVPRKAFLPWPQKQNIIGKCLKHAEYLCVVAIEGKKNLFTEIIDERLIPAYWFFVHHNMCTRKGRVIGLMESWQPGCGIGLIKMGYNVFTQFGDLKPDEILRIFKEFSTWDSFESSFLPCLERSPSKMKYLLF